MVDTDIRGKLRGMVEASGLSQRECADLIAEATGRPCAERTLRSWLASPEAATAIEPKPWALEALERGLELRKKPRRKRKAS